MTRPAIEVADIVRRRRRQFLERFKAVLSYQQLKAYRAVERCRTAALGGHKDKCEDCAYEAPISYNSCRSRSCPKCQAQVRKRWLQIQQRDLLNTNYFHVVFTLPHELNTLALTSRRPVLDLLFEASSQTLLEVAADPKRLGAEIGFLSILHTWSSNLLPHYDAHCVVPGGGLSADHQRWINTCHPMFLVPVPVLRTVFRNKFLAGLHHLYRKGLLNLRGPAAAFLDPACFEQLTDKLGKKRWYVYAKPPFGGPEHVLRYLGRYTHRMAISNHRITAFDGERVSFRWRDYAHGGKQRVMTLDAVNFLCRFFLHVLPKGFVRTRYTENGLLEIDNSAAERALRAVALGRKNYLFAGSDCGGERAAAMYSLIGTAKLNGLDPELYLRNVLALIPDHPISRIEDLLPWNLAPYSKDQSSQAA